MKINLLRSFYLNKMKTAFLTTLLLNFSLDLAAQNSNNNGQGVTQWKTNGNIADTNQFIGTKNNSPLIFRSNDTERLRITPGGNIGIGTSTPEAKLDVNGDVIFRDNVKLTGIPFSNGLTNILFVDENGNVNKAPTLSLTEIMYLPQLCPQGEGPVLNPTWANGTNKIFIACPQVNVGIGTTVPNYSLDVRGYGYLKNGLKVGLDVTYNMPALIEGTDALSNARPWIRFTDVNNGTNETAFLVNKDGGLYCTSVRVRLREDIPVPDYVFKPGYKLMPLSELKTFVSINSHLPNIPSEKEIKEEGLSLEEMQLKLLQKVEELTLYVIEISEENEKLKLKNEELDKKIEELIINGN